MSKLYYTPPSDECFQDIKSKAIKLWDFIAVSPRYLKEKTERIDAMDNVGDNFMTIFAMFDDNNQKILGKLISEDTIKAINERLIDGGSPEYLLL